MQADYAWLKQLFEDARVLKDAYERDLPEMNLADNVVAMAALREETEFGVDYSRLADIALGQASPWDEQDALETSPHASALDAEKAWVEEVANGLTGLACSYKQTLPKIDITDSVMRAIAGEAHAEPRVSFRARLISRRARILSWASLAAAASILMAAGFIASLMPDGELGAPKEMASNVHGSHNPQDVLAGLSEAYENLHRPYLSEPNTILEEVPEPDMSALTFTQVADAARKWGSDPVSRRQIQQWAALTANEARSLIDGGQAPAGAVIAAAASLPSSEQAAAMYAVIGYLKDQPAAQFALARAQQESKQAPEVTQKSLETLSALDPDNALSYYLQARMLLEAGDVQGALELLAQARQLDSATAYGLDSARYTVEALLASGLDIDTARMLAALTAGGKQYEFLCQLGYNLLQYGQSFESAGDSSTAEELYQSVQRLGEQLNNGETLVPERLAGLDMEQAAITLMSQVYTLLGSMDGLQTLATEAVELVSSLESLNAFVESVDAFYASVTDLSLFNSYADQVLENGHRSMLEAFRSGASSVS